MKYEHLTLERLEEMLDFDPATGIFRWRQRPHKKSRKRVGDVAGTPKVNQNGRTYRVLGIDGRSYQASQVAFFYHHKRWPRGEIGLVNGDADDLRPDNLIERRTTANKHDLTTKEGRVRYQGDYWVNNADYRRELGFKRYYGISFAEYQKLYDAQGGVCCLCKKPETSMQGDTLRSLAVDHSHEDDRIRGLLCIRCNMGIGYLQESAELLDAAAAYLRIADTGLTISPRVIPKQKVA